MEAGEPRLHVRGVLEVKHRDRGRGRKESHDPFRWIGAQWLYLVIIQKGTRGGQMDCGYLQYENQKCF